MNIFRMKKQKKIQYVPFEFRAKNIKVLTMDTHKQFEIVYIPKLQIYLLSVFTIGTCYFYNKYYSITEEDYKLYQENTYMFYGKFKEELSGRSTKRFVASENLEDYDGVIGFHHLSPCPKNTINPFQNHAYINGIFYARIQWADGEILVPPFQAIPCGDIYELPLRKFCEPYIHTDNRTICYKYTGYCSDN